MEEVVTRKQWAIDFLEGIGAPVTRRTLLVVLSWIQAEGGTAWYNALNCTKVVSGSWQYNWAHVQNYPSYSVGVRANIDTLVYGAEHDQYGYKQIRHRLKENMGALRTLHAVESSSWGTGGLAKQVLAMIKVGTNFKKYSDIPVFPTGQ